MSLSEKFEFFKPKACVRVRTPDGVVFDVEEECCMMSEKLESIFLSKRLIAHTRYLEILTRKLGNQEHLTDPEEVISDPDFPLFDVYEKIDVQMHDPIITGAIVRNVLEWCRRTANNTRTLTWEQKFCAAFTTDELRLHATASVNLMFDKLAGTFVKYIAQREHGDVVSIKKKKSSEKCQRRLEDEEDEKEYRMPWHADEVEKSKRNNKKADCNFLYCDHSRTERGICDCDFYLPTIDVSNKEQQSTTLNGILVPPFQDPGTTKVLSSAGFPIYERVPRFYQ